MLPDLRNRFLEGSENPKLYIEPALPNITGTWRQPTANVGPGHETGAFYYAGNYGYASDYNHGGGGTTTGFNAARCSSIYQNGINTVQPPAFTVRYYIRAQ